MICRLRLLSGSVYWEVNLRLVPGQKPSSQDVNEK